MSRSFKSFDRKNTQIDKTDLNIYFVFFAYVLFTDQDLRRSAASL